MLYYSNACDAAQGQRLANASHQPGAAQGRGAGAAASIAGHAIHAWPRAAAAAPPLLLLELSS